MAGELNGRNGNGTPSGLFWAVAASTLGLLLAWLFYTVFDQNTHIAQLTTRQNAAFDHSSWQDKQLYDSEQRIRQLELKVRP